MGSKRRKQGEGRKRGRLGGVREEERGGERRGRGRQGGRDRIGEVLGRTIDLLLDFLSSLPRGRVVYTQRGYC